MPRESLNVEAVRDLLGIVRALWGVAEQRGHAQRAEVLRRVGIALKGAIRIAREPQSTAAQIAGARRQVDRAIELMAEAIGWVDTLEEVVAVSQSRASGMPVQRPDAMQKRLNRVKRG